MDLLEKCVDFHKLKIVSVTESWAKDKTDDGLYALKGKGNGKGFKMYRNDRDSKGGGEQYCMLMKISSKEPAGH